MGAQQSTVGRSRSFEDEDRLTFQGLNNGVPSTSGGGGGVTQVPRRQRKLSDQRDERPRSTFVIVNRPSTQEAGARIEEDPLFQKLNQLPMFVPLMYEVDTASKLFGTKTRALQDIRGKLQPTPFIRIVRVYEDRLRKHGEGVSMEQARLTKCMREVDIGVLAILKILTERQKKFAKHVDTLTKMNDVTHVLNKCQTMLKDCERNLQILNGFLPIEERLEPFSWAELLEEVDKEGIGSPTNSTRCKPKPVLDESIEIAVEQTEDISS